MSKKSIVKNDSLDEDGEVIDYTNLASVRKHFLDINRRYTLEKEHLYKLTQRYFNQSISSNYISEKSIRELLNNCEKLKNEYSKFKKMIDSINSQ